MLLVAERLLSLRLSMNTPVVATEELPAGPARAAIAIHSEAGRTCFTVAVRSLRQGISVLYELEGEDVTQRDGQVVALDASLSFGESMGFLFDDEMIVDRQPATLRQAVARLREIVSAPGLDVDDLSGSWPGSRASDSETPGHGGGPVEDGGESIDDDGGEILLEEAVEQAVVEPPPATMPPSGGPMLTKFRAGSKPAPAVAKAPAAPTVAAAGGARLGRVQPIRLRAPGAAPAVAPLLRLLAAF